MNLCDVTMKQCGNLMGESSIGSKYHDDLPNSRHALNLYRPGLTHIETIYEPGGIQKPFRNRSSGTMN